MNDIPAFPTAQYADGVRPSGFDNGMTLRDYFAAKAMQAFIGREDYVDTPSNCIALDAYDMANEMIKARSEA